MSLERIMLRRGMLRAQVEAERRRIASELAPFAGPLRIAERGWDGVRFLGEHPLAIAAAVAAVGALRPRRALRWARTGLAAWQAWRWISSTLPGPGPTRH